MILPIEEIRVRLKGHDMRALAIKLKVHENVLYRVMGGATPRYDTLVKLSEYAQQIIPQE